MDPRATPSEQRDASWERQALLDASPVSSFLIDLDGTLRALDAAAARHLGGEAGELVGASVYARLPAGAGERLREEAGRAARERRDVRFEEERLGRRLATSIRPVAGGDGRVTRLAVFATDVTGQLEAQRALERSEEPVRARLEARLEALLSPAGDTGALRLDDVVDVPGLQAILDALYRVTRIGFGLIDLEGRVLVATGWQDICTLFHRVGPGTLRNCVESDTVLSAGIEPGRTKLYRCQNGMWDIATPVRIGERHVANIFLGQFFFTDDEVDVEAFRARARLHGFDEGAYLAALARVPRWSRETVEAIVAFYARLAGLISTLSYRNVALARTVAERDTLVGSILEGQEQIRALNAGLERRVAARTAELEAANRELASFSRAVSHDLRAPLRAVDGFSAALAEEAWGHLSGDERGHVERIRAGVRRMTALVDDLLRLARVTRGELSTAPTDLGGLAAALAAEIQAEAPERRVAWVIAPGVEAECDAGLPRVVLENLLRNAWKFTSAHAAARIEFGEERTGGERAFFVRDDGAGFDPRHAAKLFAPFQRLHAETEFPGSGIGLATVANVVRRHGGRVWAEGEEEKGATFRFTLGA